MRNLIKLKAIYEILETVTDRCEDVANIIEGIVSRTRERIDRCKRTNQLRVARSPDRARADFDFMNGFHDAANSIATVVSTGVLKPQTAVALGGVLQLRRDLRASACTSPTTIGKGIIDPSVVDQYVIFGALIGAIVWNLITWYYGIPSSLVARADRRLGRRGGGQGGHRRAASAAACSRPSRFIVLVAAARLRARLAAHGRSCRGCSVAPTPRRSTSWFRRLQLVSAALLQPRPRRQRRAEDHGHHLAAADRRRLRSAPSDRRRPSWVDHRAATRAIGARHAVRRLAHRQDHGHEDHQAQAGRRLLRRDRRRDHAVPRHALGIPVSTTHTITGAIVGVGSAQKLVGGALGRRRQHRLGVDPHHPGLGVRGGDRLVDRPAFFLGE